MGSSPQWSFPGERPLRARLPDLLHRCATANKRPITPDTHTHIWSSGAAAALPEAVVSRGAAAWICCTGWAMPRPRNTDQTHTRYVGAAEHRRSSGSQSICTGAPALTGQALGCNDQVEYTGIWNTSPPQHNCISHYRCGLPSEHNIDQQGNTSMAPQHGAPISTTRPCPLPGGGGGGRLSRVCWTPAASLRLFDHLGINTA